MPNWVMNELTCIFQTAEEYNAFKTKVTEKNNNEEEEGKPLMAATAGVEWEKEGGGGPPTPPSPVETIQSRGHRLHRRIPFMCGSSG